MRLARLPEWIVECAHPQRGARSALIAFRRAGTFLREKRDLGQEQAFPQSVPVFLDKPKSSATERSDALPALSDARNNAQSAAPCDRLGWATWFHVNAWASSWIHNGFVNNHSGDRFAVSFLLRGIDTVSFRVYCQAGVPSSETGKSSSLPVVIGIIHLEYRDCSCSNRPHRGASIRGRT